MKKSKIARLIAMSVVLVMMLGLLAGCVDTSGEAAPAESGAAPAASEGGETTLSGDVADPMTEDGNVKVGFVWPLTGGSATIGQQHNDGAMWAIEEINANGGIQSMGGALIEAVVADSETQPDIGSTQVERLITNDGVAIVCGAYNSAVTFPASEVAQRYGVPFLSQGGVSNVITERDYEWVFRINNKATYDVEEMLKGIDLLAEETGQEVKTYALIYESTDWGSDNAKIWQEFAEERGWEMVLDEPVTVGQSDMSSQVQKIKAADPDVVNVSFYTPEMIVFSKAMTANQVNPPLGIWSVGGGSQDPAYFEAVEPREYEYNFVQEDWDVSGPLNHDWIAELNEEVYAANGYYLNSFFAQGWTAAYVAYEALEAAGSADPEAIREALVNLDIENDGETRVILSGYPRIKFDEDGQNTYSTGTIVQYQNGEAIGLSPEANRYPDAVPIVPIPDDFDTRGQ